MGERTLKPSTRIRLLLSRLYAGLLLRAPLPSELHYVGGSENLPPPLTAERALLLCFRPEGLTVDGQARRDLLVAVSPNRLSPEGRFDAIIRTS